MAVKVKSWAVAALVDLANPNIINTVAIKEIRGNVFMPQIWGLTPRFQARVWPEHLLIPAKMNGQIIKMVQNNMP